MFNPETANVLPNGAVILDRRRIGDTWVWFCEFGGCQPYVTWVSGHNSADCMDWGHYHSRFINGYEDFCERIRLQWEYVNSFGS